MINNLVFTWVEREHYRKVVTLFVHNRIVLRQGKYFLSMAINPKLATTEYGEREITKKQAIEKITAVCKLL